MTNAETGFSLLDSHRDFPYGDDGDDVQVVVVEAKRMAEAQRIGVLEQHMVARTLEEEHKLAAGAQRRQAPHTLEVDIRKAEVPEVHKDYRAVPAGIRAEHVEPAEQLRHIEQLRRIEQLG